MFIRDLPPVWKNGLILVGGVLALLLLYQLWSVIAPFCVSVVAAYILNPIIRKIEHWGIPRAWGVLLFYILAIAASILILVPMTLNIFSEAHELSVRLSAIDVGNLTREYRAKGQTLIASYSENPLIRNYLEVSLSNEKVQDLAAQAVILAKDLVIRFFKGLFKFVFSTFSSFLGLFFLPLLTFYLLVDLDLLYKNSLLLVPPIYRESTTRIAGDIDIILSGFLRGQIIACLIFGSLMTLGLWLSGLHFSVLLGPFAGLANLVPYLGGLVTVVLSTVVALSQCGLSQALLFMMVKIAITLAIVQGIDGFFLQPRVIGENVGLHPLVVMFVLVVSGSLFGMVGMILSIPVTCILKVLSGELYHELYDQN